MRNSLRIGRIAGVPVAIHWSLVLVAVLLTWSLAEIQLPRAAPGLDSGSYLLAALIAAALFFASILAHEVGHAVVARRHGMRTEDITLWLFGGVARIADDAPTPSAELQVAAAGPAVSLALGVVSAAAAVSLDATGSSDVVFTVAVWLAAINIILAVFNLLPGAPLDGGRILSALLWRWHGDRTRAAITAARAGATIGVVLVALPVVALVTDIPVGGSLWTAAMGVFLIQLSRTEAEGARIRGALAGRRVVDVMTPVEAEVPDWWTIDDLAARTPAAPWTPHPRLLVVVGWNGAPTGLVRLDALDRVPHPERTYLRLRDVSIRPAVLHTARPDDAVLDVLRRPPPPGVVGIAVVDGGRVVGLVTDEELAHLTPDRLAGSAPRATPERPTWEAAAGH